MWCFLKAWCALKWDAFFNPHGGAVIHPPAYLPVTLLTQSAIHTSLSQKKPPMHSRSLERNSQSREVVKINQNKIGASSGAYSWWHTGNYKPAMLRNWPLRIFSLSVSLRCTESNIISVIWFVNNQIANTFSFGFKKQTAIRNNFYGSWNAI